MPRFFVSPDAIKDGVITVSGDDAFHISHSLRMRVGETVTVCSRDMTEYECRLQRISDTVTCEIISSAPSKSEPPYTAVIYQALCKGDKFDTVVQKSVEMGAAKIVPVITKRCTVKLDDRSAASKTARWMRIAAEASKQCGRGREIKVGEPLDFDAALKEAAKADVPLFCYEGDGTSSVYELLHGRDIPTSASVFIGPEGGFEKTEFESAIRAGMLPCGLGKRILRTESASTAVLACLSYEYELRLPIGKE